MFTINATTHSAHPQPTAKSHLPWTGFLALAALLLLGVGLRSLALDEETAWCDEVLTAICFPADSYADYLRRAFDEDAVPRLAPLYYIAQYTWSIFFGGSLLSLRYLSIVLYGVAAIQLYALVNAIGGRGAALWSVFLFSVSLFEIYYGQEVRFYALINVFALAGIHGALWYSRGHLARGLLLGLVGNAGLIWTHVFGVPLVIAMGLYMLRFYRRPRWLAPWWIAHGCLAAVFVGWLIWIRYDIDKQSTAYNDIAAGWRELVITLVRFSGGRFTNLSPAPYMPGGISLDGVITLVVVLLVAGLLVQLWRGKLADRLGTWSRGDIALLLVCLLVPGIMLYTIGRLWRPYYFTRYIVYSALPLYALTGLALHTIPWHYARRFACVLLVCLFAWQVLALPRPFRADYGAVTRAVAADPAEEQVVLVLKLFNYKGVAYAFRDTDVETDLLLGLKEIIRVSIQQAEKGVSVWAVFYKWDALTEYENQVKAAGMTVRRFDSAGMPPLTLYHVTNAATPSVQSE